MKTVRRSPEADLLVQQGSGLELEYPARLVEPSGWLAHVPFAMWLVGALKPRMIVELGVHTGNSYCAFLQAVHTLGLDTQCFGVRLVEDVTVEFWDNNQAINLRPHFFSAQAVAPSQS